MRSRGLREWVIEVGVGGALALFGALALPNNSATDAFEKPGEGAPVLLPPVPSGARMVETYALSHRLADGGEYKIVFETLEYQNETDGFSVLCVYNRAGELNYAEFGQPPLAAGVRPIVVRAGKTDLLVAEYYLGYDRRNPSILRIYSLDDPAQARAVLRLADGPGAGKPLTERVADFDQDGNVEVLNYCQPAVEELRGSLLSRADIFCVLSVYQYVPRGSTPDWTPRFERVKGKGFETQFMAHADWLLRVKYPEALSAGMTPALQGIVLSWLATVESTQNPDRIREALRTLDTLPSPDTVTKKALVALLAKHGYPLLGVVRQ